MMKISRKLMVSFGMICSLKTISNLGSFRCLAATHNYTTWSHKWFDNVQLKSPVFYCNADDIEVLKEPGEFYERLKVNNNLYFSRVMYTN